VVRGLLNGGKDAHSRRAEREELARLKRHLSQQHSELIREGSATIRTMVAQIRTKEKRTRTRTRPKTASFVVGG